MAPPPGWAQAPPPSLFPAANRWARSAQKFWAKSWEAAALAQRPRARESCRAKGLQRKAISSRHGLQPLCWPSIGCPCPGLLQLVRELSNTRCWGTEETGFFLLPGLWTNLGAQHRGSRQRSRLQSAQVSAGTPARLVLGCGRGPVAAAAWAC